MKTLLVVALLALMTPVMAQSNSGIIDRTPETNTTTDVSQTEVEKLEAEYRTHKEAPVRTVVSRNPKDMDDTTGMDAQTVITWVDRNGVRSYTDNPKLAPKSAKTRQVYSMPPASPYIPDEILIEEQQYDQHD